MFTYDDDDDLQSYFTFNNSVNYEEDFERKNTAISTKEEMGVCCRACSEFNKYASPDYIINDRKFTCWSCATHPERKRIGLSLDKVKDLEEYYKKNYITYR